MEKTTDDESNKKVKGLFHSAFSFIIVCPLNVCINDLTFLTRSCRLFVMFILVSSIADYKRTSLKESLAVFETFLKDLEEIWKGKLIEQSGT